MRQHGQTYRMIFFSCSTNSTQLKRINVSNSTENARKSFFRLNSNNNKQVGYHVN
uniref:Uncharacterized protein n=1 Tax=Anguilla anguilla TaxID=7936 RepID=A0A0E9VRB7_ANGAN